MKIKEHNLNGLWYNIKQSNMYADGVPEEEKM